MSTKQLTIRGVESEIHNRLKIEASKNGMSVNKYLLKLIKDAVGEEAKAPITYHDLDHLAGTWTETEATEFETIIEEHRQIDWEMWQ